MAMIPRRPQPQQQMQRVSQGLYRDARGNIVRSTTGAMPQKKIRKPKPAAQPPQAPLPDDNGAMIPQITQPQQPMPQPPETPATPEPTQFRGIRDFQQTDFQNDPVFKSSLDMGQKEISRLMASRGLLGSGAEVEANADLLSRLSGQLGNKYLDLAQADANRFDAQQGREADYRTGREDAQYDRYFRTMDMMLGQSPMDYAYKGLGKYGDYTGELGNAISNYQRNNYNKVYGPAGGGGGGGGAPMYLPPVPKGPYTGDIDAAQALGGGAGSQAWVNAFTDSLGSILPAFL